MSRLEGLMNMNGPHGRGELQGPVGVIHLPRRTYITAAPRGMYITVTGNWCASWLVIVRPAIMPTAAPKTASLNQWRLAGNRDMATYDANV